MKNEFFNRLEFYGNEITKALENFLPDDGGVLTEAMRYSLFSKGKLIRPIIVLEFCKMSGGDFKKAIPFACAIEMIHSYSLIYDDLPCMDNDTMRRGKKTNHMVFGEGIALMSGAALYSEAFNIITANYKNFNLTDRQCINGISVLNTASGREGILVGQVLDMENVDKNVTSLTALEKIHSLKTGAMIEASALLGCIAADADDMKMLSAKEFAKYFGLAFQVRDDILDVIGDQEKLGKSIGKDKKGDKTTFVDIMGLQEAQNCLVQYSETAKEHLKEFNDNSFMMSLTDMMCNREK